VSADFDVAGFRAQLDDAPEEILSADNGELLIALGPLALGAHHLRVQALAHAKGTTAPVGATAQFDFTVAPPQPWPEAMREKAGFRVLLDPPNAGLEQLFSGRATLRLLGPAGRSVLWSLETFDAAGHPTAIGVGGQTTIGAPAGAIATTLDRLRQTNSEAIDNAHRVDIVASLGELGRQSVAFPHQVDPLRWHFDSSSRQVRLIDESAHESPVAVRSYALSAPVAQKTIDYDEAVTGIEVGAPGALMVADYEHRRFSLFASAPASDRLNSLADLGIAQTLTIAKSDLDATLILLSSLWRWHGARSVGPQAVIRKVMTLDRIESELAARLCGQDLMHALSQREATPFTRAQSLVGGSPGFGFRMRTFPSLGSEEGKALFAEIACRYAIESDSVRCGIAYALAFSPATLRLGKAEAARSQMADLLANRVLLRGAFLARTASHAAGQAALSETA
jgi:hypothetical protein